MHCNLQLAAAPEAAPVLIRYHYEAHAKFKVAELISFRAVLLLIRYATL